MKVRTIPVIGLIGSIGAGKSAAAAAFAQRGGRVVNADALGHRALELAEVKRALVERWGERILKPEGGVDRRAVAGIVFANDDERRALERIVFPPIGQLTDAEIAAAEADPDARFVVLDAAVLLEAGWKDRCNRIVYVDAPYEVRLARLAARSHWSADDLRARELAQWPEDEKRKCSSAIVMNDGSLVRLQERVDHLVREWKL